MAFHMGQDMKDVEEKKIVFKARNKACGAVVDVMLWPGHEFWNYQMSQFFEEYRMTIGVCKYNGSLDFHQGERFVSVRPCHYLVKSRGQLYACSPEVFKMTYETMEVKR